MLSDFPDLDIWYNPTYENYYNILKVIETLGQDITEFMAEQTPNPRQSFFKLNFDEYTLDLLPKLKSPFKFVELYKRKETVELDGVEIHFMNYPDLITEKIALGRKKDWDDIEELKKKQGE